MKKFLFLFVCIPLFYIPCFISDQLCVTLTREDGFYEYSGAFLFFLTSLLFALLAYSSKFYSNYNNTVSQPKRFYFWILAALFFFAFGEEISWGQRIIGYATPESIQELNMQGEFNLHNLEIFNGKNSEGDIKKGLSKLITMRRLFYFTFIFYLLVIPILYTQNTKARSLLKRIGLPVPDMIFGVLFVSNILFSKTIKYFYNEIVKNQINIVAEIKETLFALLLFILALSWFKFPYTKKKALAR